VGQVIQADPAPLDDNAPAATVTNVKNKASSILRAKTEAGRILADLDDTKSQLDDTKSQSDLMLESLKV
jgi:hypothetical protein